MNSLEKQNILAYDSHGILIVRKYYFLKTGEETKYTDEICRDGYWILCGQINKMYKNSIDIIKRKIA